MNDLASISEAIRVGSESAFEALFRAEFQSVAFFVGRYVRDREQADPRYNLIASRFVEFTFDIL